MIGSDARAFQSSLKCRFFDPSWQYSIRESRAYFNVFFDPYEIENVKQKNKSKRSNLICRRGQVQRPFSCDSLAVRRILVLLMTSNEPNEHRQLGRTAQRHHISCKAFDVFLHYGILLNGSVDLIRVLLSFQCTKALLSLTAKLGPDVDGAACVFGLSRNAYQRHFSG